MKKIKSITLLSAALVMLLWLATLFFMPMRFGKEAGIYGDMFGAVNSLFSGLALIALICAAWMQKIEIETQKSELVAVEKDRVLQRFESNFFELLRLREQSISSISMHLGNSLKYGRDVLNELANIHSKNLEHSVLTALYSCLNDENISNDIKWRDLYSKKYDELYSNGEIQLGTLTNGVYIISQFIDRSAIDHDSKKFYASVFCNQLSIHEQSLLLYYGLSNRGFLSMKPFLDKYGLLRHLSHKDIPGFDILKKQYNETAFTEV